MLIMKDLIMVLVGLWLLLFLIFIFETHLVVLGETPGSVLSKKMVCEASVCKAYTPAL